MRQRTGLREQQDRPPNLRLLHEINAGALGHRSVKLRDWIAELALELDSADRGRAERADLASKVLELPQSLQEMWPPSDPAAKRQILDFLCLNFDLDVASLVPTMRKPFDLLVEGLLVSSIGATRFELATSWSRTKRSTKLSYAPELHRLRQINVHFTPSEAACKFTYSSPPMNADARR